MAQTPEEEQRQRRRKRLMRGLLLGGAALGLPALVNAIVASNARRRRTADWGPPRRTKTEDPASFHRLGETGANVLLVHSLGPGHSALEWRAVAEELSAEHRVYAVDLPGWGRSLDGRPVLAASTYERFLEQFVEREVGEPTFVIAAGMTCHYAVAAARSSERIVGLGLVAPTDPLESAPAHDTTDAIVHGLLRTPILGTAALNLYTREDSLRRYQRRQFGPDGDESIVARLYAESHRPGAHRALAAYLCGALDPAPLPAEPLETAAWVVWGRDASNPPVEQADRWLLRFEASELAILEGCGSHPHAQDPQRFVEAWQAFVRPDSRASA